MKWLAVAILAAAAPVVAAPAKVIVLPLDGDAPAEARTALAAELATAARHDGSVTTGTTTYRETAAAVGCDPDNHACATTVLSTLGVDEIIYGTATAAAGNLHVRIARVTLAQRSDRTFDVAQGAPAGSELAPLFGESAAPAAEPAPASPAGSFFDTRDRTLGVAFAAGGGVALLIGLVLWASEHDTQNQIEAAPDATLADVQGLVALEQHASNEAWAGNVMVVLGLAAGGVGGYFLWRDHKARATVVPAEHGVALVVEGAW
ncbi:MAG TPA: hypothetical protein VGG74_25205 [Kofleriaceae bacterium]